MILYRAYEVLTFQRSPLTDGGEQTVGSRAEGGEAMETDHRRASGPSGGTAVELQAAPWPGGRGCPTEQAAGKAKERGVLV